MKAPHYRPESTNTITHHASVNDAIQVSVDGVMLQWVITVWCKQDLMPQESFIVSLAHCPANWFRSQVGNVRPVRNWD